MAAEYPPIRVVIADDHPLIRTGLRAVLERSDGIEVVAVVGDGPAAVQAIDAYQPGVALLDIQLPGMSGIDVARGVRTAHPQIAILILTGYDDVGYVRTLLPLGIRGYLTKTVSDEQLVAAIRTVATGGTVLVSDSIRLAADANAGPLTTRELDVLEHIAVGRRNAEIASLLALSVKTVEYHVSRALEKLGARSRVEAVHKARQLGIIAPEAG
jgi:DNA-binding NarL/FixJ family response regulator